MQDFVHQQYQSDIWGKEHLQLPSLRLTRNIAPENGCLEYHKLSFWGVDSLVFRGIPLLLGTEECKFLEANGIIQKFQTKKHQAPKKSLHLWRLQIIIGQW